ncbi:hypothetical protein DER30_6847 [Streptomyces sp. HB202]|nr:hypothetical protein DER30_6847 [Streptomyces sp. HB202]
MLCLVAQLEESDDLEGGAHVSIRQVADCGVNYGPLRLAELRVRAGDPNGAETLAWQAADRGDESTLFRLVELREKNEDVRSAEDLNWQIASCSSEELFTRNKIFHRRWPHGFDPDGQPRSPWQR